MNDEHEMMYRITEKQKWLCERQWVFEPLDQNDWGFEIFLGEVDK